MSNGKKLGIFVTLGLAIASASLSTPAFAQLGRPYGNGNGPYGNGNGNYGNGNGPYGNGNGNYGNGNGPYGNGNGNYGNGNGPYGNGNGNYSNGNGNGNSNYGGGYYGGRGERAQQFFDNFRSDAHQFRKHLGNTANDNSSNDSRRDNFQQLVENFDDAVNQLRSNFKNGNNINSDVRNVLDYGNRIENLMQRVRFSNSNVQQDWSKVSSELKLLSRVSYRGRNF